MRRHDFAIATRQLAEANRLENRVWARRLVLAEADYYRALAHLLSISKAEVKRLVRVRYTKVAEYQARGAVHFHAVIRLDAAPPRDDPEQVAPPPAGFCADLLAEAVTAAATTVAVSYPEVDQDATERLARWGDQLDVRNVTRDGTELSAEQVAGYVAKYATAMIRLVVAVGSDPVRHRRDAGPWICRPATATTARAAVAWV